MQTACRKNCKPAKRPSTGASRRHVFHVMTAAQRCGMQVASGLRRMDTWEDAPYQFTEYCCSSSHRLCPSSSRGHHSERVPEEPKHPPPAATKRAGASGRASGDATPVVTKVIRGIVWHHRKPPTRLESFPTELASHGFVAGAAVTASGSHRNLYGEWGVRTAMEREVGDD